MPNLYRPPFGSPLSPLTRAVTEGGGGGFSISSLFAAGEQGGIWDPSDLSTVFSDAAGTTPAVVDGVVGMILDKSGRGNHRTQSTTAQKPFLRSSGGLYWLEYDGVDDGMVTAAVDFTATDKVTVCAALRKASDAARGIFLEGTGSAGIFRVEAPSSASPTLLFGHQGANTTAVSAASSGFAAPITAVVSGLSDMAAPLATLRVNGASAATNSSATGGGTFNSSILYFGRRSGTTLPFNGREYYTVIRGATSTAAQVSSTERIAAQKCGVTL